MKRKILICLFTFLLIISLVFQGCNKNETEESTKSPDATENTTESGESKMVGNMYKEGLPIVKDKVTLKVIAEKDPVAKDWNKMDVIKNLEAKTNIHLDFELVPSTSYMERIGLVFATNELPDCFISYGKLGSVDQRYGMEQQLIPLQDLVDEWAPNIKKMFERYPSSKSLSISADGNMYSIPRVGDNGVQGKIHSILYINNEWLKELDLKVPTTTDEYYNVLKAFKEKDPNGNSKKDEIPFSFAGAYGKTGIGSMFGAFGVPDSEKHIIISDDNKVIFTPMQPEYVDAVKYFNRLFSEGLMDIEGFMQIQSQLSAKGREPVTILGAFTAYHSSAIVGEDKASTEYTHVLPLKGPEGKQMWHLDNPAPATKVGQFAITSKSKNPEIIMRWLDAVYDEDTSWTIQMGEEDVTWRKTADGKMEQMPVPEGMSELELKLSNSPVWYFPGVFYTERYERLKASPTVERKQQITAAYMPYTPKNAYPVTVHYKQEESDRLAALQVDINNYIKTSLTTWITQGGVEQEWDHFVDKLKDMGVEELIEIYQTSYKRFINN